MKRRGPPKRRPTPRQRAWWSSARFRDIGRQTCLRINASRRAAVKCGARKKSDGEPCRNLPLANGKCRLHGGATPSGTNWHRPTFARADTPTGAAKFERKLADLRRRTKQLMDRRAAMTPKEAARYAAWQRTHQPGSAGGRAAARSEAAQNAAIRWILARPDKPITRSDEVAAIGAVLAELERRLADIQQPAGPADNGDVFA
ncbi:HGGxSTG domain-containing protein [Methylobacterium sp. Leaf466]|uniref:HGGxSTG domain-containing protein n=1 Tax=Methylobacterium sp. Leaf466 TaxID=1736386 RepID=UPI0012E33979|nr:HGGxSTG domain-containing protein [Methylobacterium sp. Leaf466]